METQQTAPRDYLIVALDVPGRKEAMKLAEELSGRVGYFKIGLQLFTACGPDIVRDINKLGGRVFLDLKLHDIPNTVAKAVYEAARMEVSLLTLHTLGGGKMMSAAAKSAREAAETLGVTPPRLLGVTILTSMDQEEASKVGLSDPIAKTVLKLARLAESSGIDGIVCSPLELETLSADRPGDLFFVTPGIRPAGSDINDQSRITTPAEAVAKGARHLVVGRPITQADNPAQAADRIVAEIAGACQLTIDD
jgi:orotidine-5'-phosphate decarboxylase